MTSRLPGGPSCTQIIDLKQEIIPRLLAKIRSLRAWASLPGASRLEDIAPNEVVLLVDEVLPGVGLVKGVIAMLVKAVMSTRVTHLSRTTSHLIVDDVGHGVTRQQHGRAIR